MPKAVIDIGSNSIRLALSDGTVYSRITKLADGLAERGRLSPEGIRTSLEVISDFVKSAGTDDIYIFATEAVRRAEDGAKFCSLVQSLCGRTVHVLSEEQEAELALKGADKPEGAVVVCDLGGGSMELIASPDGRMVDYVKSLPLGVVVLKNRYRGDIVKAREELPKLIKEYGAVPRYTPVISGGSACAIAAFLLGLEKYDKKAVTARFTANELDKALPSLSDSELLSRHPVCARRADTVPYGAAVIRALLDYLDASFFYVSDAGNLDAVLRS